MNIWTQLLTSLGLGLASITAAANPQTHQVRNLEQPFINSSRTSFIVFTSDPQYPWTNYSDHGGEISSSDNQRLSRQLIEEQYQSVAEYRHSLPGLHVPVMINGDMTAFGHGWQRKYVYSTLDRLLQSDYYFGMGNHDYENNIGDCGSNGCARDSLFDLKLRMQPKVDNMDLRIETGLVTEDWSGSLSYSKIYDDVQLIQLNNEPTYRATFSSTPVLQFQFKRYGFEITPSLDWLEQELERASAANRIIILNMHKPDEWMASTEERDRFKAMIQKHQVAVAFAGHHHGRAGKFDRSGFFGNVPLFLSGSSSQRTYLTAEIDRRAGRINVRLISQNDWKNGIVIARVPLPAREQAQ